MANQKKLENWLATKSSWLNLKVEELTWTEKLELDLYDFQVFMQINNETFVGRGTDTSLDTALLKASVEGLERFLLRQLKVENSNGLAAHYDLDSAKQSAVFELIERHIFLSYFLTNTPFPEICNSDILDDRIQGFIRFAKSKHANLRLSIIEIDNIGFFGFACVDGLLLQRPFGIIVGASVAKKSYDALFKACIEALRSFTYEIEIETDSSICLKDFLVLSNPSFEDHGNLALDLDYANEVLKDLFIQSNGQHRVSVPHSEVEYTVFDCSKTVLNIPLYLVHTKSSLMQKLFKGAGQDNDINREAIEAIHGKFTLRSIPHPFR